MQWLQMAATTEKAAGRSKAARPPDCRDSHLAEVLRWGLVSKSPSQKISLSEPSREPVYPTRQVHGMCCWLFMVGVHPPQMTAAFERSFGLLLSGFLVTCLSTQGGNLIHFSIPKLERMWQPRRTIQRAAWSFDRHQPGCGPWVS